MGSATVTELEQYQASGSLPGTLNAIWSLRSFNLVSACLVFCWSWYYLGSQATAYEYVLAMSTPSTHFPIALPSHGASSIFLDKAGRDDVVTTNVGSQFLTSYGQFSNSWGHSGADQNGAVLVPMWGITMDDSAYGQSDFKVDHHGWWDAIKTSEVVYSSAIGLPFYSIMDLMGFNGVGSLVGNVLINATYLNMTCDPPTFHDAADFPKNTVDMAAMTINMTSATFPNTTDNLGPPATFDIWLRVNTTSQTLRSSCMINTVFLQVMVHCPGTICAASKTRLMTGSDLLTNRSPFDDRDFGDAFFSRFMVSNGVPSNKPDAPEYKISIVFATILDAIDDYSGEVQYPDLSDEDYEDSVAMSLSMSITQIINTYYQASLVPQLSGLNGVGAESINDIISGQSVSPDWETATFEGAHYYPHYHLSITWITIDIISCIFLIACAFLAMQIRKKTIAPDIFGYVSSLTRDNPNVDLPDGGSTLSGFERARLMKHVKIKIADVSGDPEVGRIGVRHAGYSHQGVNQLQSATVETAQLQRNRPYL